MKLRINGKPESVHNETTVNALLLDRGQDGRVAVAVNGEFVPRDTYHETVLQDGDEVEILAPMQGG